MDFWFVIILALALAMDAFAVSLGMSFNWPGLTPGQSLKMALHFGFFQFFMPLIGWLAGQGIIIFIRAFDHWVAFSLLLFIGVKMIYKASTGSNHFFQRKSKPAEEFSLLLLSVATSIDALAAGLSLAALRSVILFPALIIGIIAFLMSALGARIGPLVGKVIGRKAEILGGMVLIFMGIKILWNHLS